MAQVFDIRAPLLRKELADTQEVLAFWRRQHELTGDYKYTVGDLETKVATLQQQLRDAEG